MPVLTALRKAERRRQREDEDDSSDDGIDNIQINTNSDDDAPELSVKQKLANKKAELLAASNKNKKNGQKAPANNANRKQEATSTKQKKNAEDEDEEKEGSVSGSDDDEEDDDEEENQEQTVKFVEPNNWVERMSLVALKPLPDDIDPEDDPRREEAFVQHALLSVQRGVEMLDKAKIPWRRPDDYYAEMFKSDVHMDKIRRAIESTKTAVQERMKRRMIKEQKQYGKQVQADVLRQRAQEKRSMMAKVSELRKRKNRGGNDQAGDKLDELFGDDDDDKKGRGGGGGGHGGGDRRSKHSARGAAFRDKSVRPGSGSGRSSGGGGRSAGKKGGGRPGKSKRR